jgi:histidine triad (HIT) family protein
MSDETVFDLILRGERPARVVYEDEDVLAFHDAHPRAPVHVLVVPKKKAASLDELADRDPLEAGRFLRGVARVARQLELVHSGYRVVVNCGRDAHQSVAYLHAHILGKRRLGWPPG